MYFRARPSNTSKYVTIDVYLCIVKNIIINTQGVIYTMFIDIYTYVIYIYIIILCCHKYVITPCV